MTIQSYLQHVCQHVGLEEADVAVEITQETDDRIEIQLTIPEDDVGLFIGHRGETLSALQRLTRIVFSEEYAEQQLVVNVNDYRQERLKQLQAKAKEVGLQVLESGQEYRFPYLSSYERFIIHSTFAEDQELQGLESFSVGEGKGRRLIVRPKVMGGDQ